MSIEPKHETILLNTLMSKKWRVVRHIIMLIPLASVFIPSVSDSASLQPHYQQVIRAVYEHGAFMFFLSVLIIYFNLLLLIPRLLFRKQYIVYAVWFLVLGFVYYLGEYFHGRYAYKGMDEDLQVPGFNVKDIIDNTLLPLIFLGATAGYKVFKKWLIDTQRLSDLERSKLQEELTSLKNQVNPHFLFNTLNNLNTLIQTDQQKASQVILGLSDVLRYQIYDSTKEQILLSKDIAMLDQFLMLEKIRRDNFRYEIATEGEIKATLVPPLLFINFIDNALKHGADTRDTSFCRLKFTLTEKSLEFDCVNSKPSMITKKESGGFGLKNIRRRLDLLYGSRYNLTLKDEPNLFSTKLCIPV
jgi:Histidine kinase/GHKL domain